MLGAKKAAPKLGAKKVTSAEVDFEEAERKAKEEAERKEKLGYDPENEQPPEPKTEKEAPASATPISSPVPASAKGGNKTGTPKKTHERNKSVERLGMGVGRLGFGQVAKPAPKKLGFGAVGPAKTRSPAEGMFNY